MKWLTEKSACLNSLTSLDKKLCCISFYRIYQRIHSQQDSLVVLPHPGETEAMKKGWISQATKQKLHYQTDFSVQTSTSYSKAKLPFTQKIQALSITWVKMQVFVPAESSNCILNRVNRCQALLWFCYASAFKNCRLVRMNCWNE